MKQWVLGLGLLLPVITNGFADTALLKQKNAQHFMHYLVEHDGFSHKELEAILKNAQFKPSIIQSMEKPYEQKTWDVYKALFLTPQRVQAGIEFWRANAQTLARAEKEYGVPANIIVAILGVETLYGKHQGEYRVLDALTTLAFYYPKRAPYFTRELREYLLLCKEHHISPTQFLGSYAGAIGKPQFMPSNYRVFAVDYAGLGKRDLVHNDKDVIGSVANFFAKHGWKSQQYIAHPITHIKQQALHGIAMNDKKANYSYQQLQALGVRPRAPLMHPPKQAGVIELTTNKGMEYWLAYPNFYVITRYNTSPQYALAVYLLSQQLQQQWALQSSHAVTTV